MSVAAAIDQQTAATHEIARNVAESGDAVLRITALMAEVSREAVTTGDQAGQLRGNAGAVADDVVALQTALVHTVRTATVEADRRLEAAGDRSTSPVRDRSGCGSARDPGRLRDISMHGATIDIGNADGISIGQHGSLVLTHAGDVRAQFEVRSSRDAPGRLHVQFLDGQTRSGVQRGDHATDRRTTIGGPAAHNRPFRRSVSPPFRVAARADNSAAP